MTNKITIRVVAAAAALGMALFAPLPASASTDGPAPASLTRAYVGGQGHATFDSHGEHLFACDDLPDGSQVQAQAMWDHEIQGDVLDLNGFGGGCGEQNLDIPDGKDVNIRACAGGYCGDWVDSEA